MIGQGETLCHGLKKSDRPDRDPVPFRGGDESQASDCSVPSAILFLLGIRVSVGVPVKSSRSTFSGIEPKKHPTVDGFVVSSCVAANVVCRRHLIPLY